MACQRTSSKAIWCAALTCVTRLHSEPHFIVQAGKISVIMFLVYAVSTGLQVRITAFSARLTCHTWA